MSSQFLNHLGAFSYETLCVDSNKFKRAKGELFVPVRRGWPQPNVVTVADPDNPAVVQINKVLVNGKEMHKGIGGTSLQIEIDNTPVFVKKVPLTDLELQTENYMSTANIFNLPMCYQYGIGSAGFGAWRELAAHVMTTNWVITGGCPNFPIMYHWRILKDVDNKIISDEEQAALDKDTAYWENNQEIHDLKRDS